MASNVLQFPNRTASNEARGYALYQEASQLDEEYLKAIEQ